MGRSCLHIASHGYAGRKQRAFIARILGRDALGDGLYALKARGWFKIGALLTAMQIDAALGTLALEVGALHQRSSAVVTTRCGYGLDKAGQAGARDIQWRLWALRWPGPIVTITEVTPVSATCVLVAVLAIFAISIHERKPRDGVIDLRWAALYFP